MGTLNSIWIGFDPRPVEAAAFAVTRSSIRRHLTQPIPISGLVLKDLQDKGLYTRETEYRKASVDAPVLWDVVSDHAMSTEHANSRFLVPYLAKTGWALFLDGDMLARDNLARLSDLLDDSKAIMCVKHNHQPKSKTKMDGQVQSKYPKKNWSSFVVFNCAHEANRSLTPELMNRMPGRDLHRFCWLDENEIGTLGPEWNWLVGHSDPAIEPKVVHFTSGPPNMPGYENVPYADEWREELNRWAA